MRMSKSETNSKSEPWRGRVICFGFRHSNFGFFSTRDLMSRQAFMLMAIVIAVAGCGRVDSGRPQGDASAESLPVLEAPSGGTLVLIPAGIFNMGHQSGGAAE